MDMMAELDHLPAEHVSSGTPTDSMSTSNVASFSSTPPTTASPDSLSVASESDHHQPDAVEDGSNSIPSASMLEAAVPLLEQSNDRRKELELTAQEAEAQVAANIQDGQLEVVATSSVARAFVEADEAARPDAPVDAQNNAQNNEQNEDDQLPSAPASFVRPRRSRAGQPPVYNLARLSSDSVGFGRATRDATGGGDKSQRTISGDTLVNGFADGETPSMDASGKTKQAVEDGIQALDMDWSMSGPSTPQDARTAKKTWATKQGEQPSRAAGLLGRVTRRSGVAPETMTSKISALGKRSRTVMSRMSRELLMLRDTNEYAHIDKGPVRYTVWSNGKYVDEEELKAREEATAAAAAASLEPVHKKPKLDEPPLAEEETDKAETLPAKKRRVKKWLDKGLYAGQAFPSDIATGLTPLEKKKLTQQPDLQQKGPPNKVLPPVIFHGLRLLLAGRDFKMPFDVCNPLPPGQPKPAQYRTITKNRFVGDAGAIWKKTPIVGDFASRCVCKPGDGCGEDCQNRSMLYECDDTNCNVGKARCTNRAFQDLQERTKKGGRYRVGVEVFKTADRGYGVRSNRCFEPNQIITEYTGEIITEEECDRRMNEVYKTNECYYLMSFDQNMIIDATTGSIARFVNHSCDPNCRMIKWIVGGQPRMALFAGDRPIMTGDELTYDYNFDPFSAKNVQKCLCGSANCRGVLGPKPREVKPPKEKVVAVAKKTVKTVKKMAGAVAAVAGAKRKWSHVAGHEDDAKSKKKQKTAATDMPTNTTTTNTLIPAGAKHSLPSTAGLKKVAKKAAKGAVGAVKHGASSISLKAKTGKGKKLSLAAALASSSSSQTSLLGSAKKGSGGVTKKAPMATSAAKRLLNKYGKTGLAASAKENKKAKENQKAEENKKAEGDKKADDTRGKLVGAASASDSPSGHSTSSAVSTIVAAGGAVEKPAATPSRIRTPSRKLLEASAVSSAATASGSGSINVSPGKTTDSRTESLTPGKKPQGIQKKSPAANKNSKSPVAKSPAQSVKPTKPRKGLELSRGAKIRVVSADAA